LRGTSVELPAKELAVLEILLRNAGRIVSRSQLESALYGWSEGVESNAVEVHIHHLRRKLGAERIHTLRGLGYRFEEMD
jgi:DNA-binding response OmpR family regulator